MLGKRRILKITKDSITQTMISTQNVISLEINKKKKKNKFRNQK